MGDEFEPDQLVEFCQRLGLGNDGYLNEQELGIVCNCIGLQAPEEVCYPYTLLKYADINLLFCFADAKRTV